MRKDFSKTDSDGEKSCYFFARSSGEGRWEAVGLGVFNLEKDQHGARQRAFCYGLLDDVLTKWFNLVSDGQDHDELFRDLYAELKQMARMKVASERRGMTLNATALVHEAWMRLEKSAPDQWRDRSQFFASAAEAMRRILVDAARRRLAAKRGSGEVPISLDELDLPDLVESERLMEVHEVLGQLEAEDPVKAAIVKLRFFCGMENEEIATILGVNEKTVRRHWALAKVWLFRAIQHDG